ncbi:MAG: aminotransferase class I/II-fold pyridoxal phosphate-dependent enzyme [Longimicrobiales bacterium]
MTGLADFEMERWQSTYENRVDYNLSESGVHPVSLNELTQLAGLDSIGELPIGYGQSNGTDQLRAHIAALYSGADIDHIVVCNGSAEANFVALWHLVEPGDEVVVVMPTYMQSIGLVDSLGGRVREVWLHPELNWQPAPSEIDAAVTDRTRIIIVTNPNNPTGVSLQQPARAAIERAAQRVGAWILADEVYTGAELAGTETPSFWQPDARVIATGSLSKAYGLPGLRIGWAVAPRELSERIWARKDYTTISPGQLTDRLATIALHPTVRPRLLARTRTYMHAGLEILEPWLTRTGIFHYRPPDAGAIVLARYNLPINSTVLVERLRREQSVLVVPGDHFRLDRCLRIGFGLPGGQLSEALQRCALLLDPLRDKASIKA